MTPVACPLSSISHHGAKYSPRRSSAWSQSSTWANQNGYELSLFSSVTLVFTERTMPRTRTPSHPPRVRPKVN
ncbi:hypothetical protein RCH05_000827 [Janthinobacterium sp. CAN_S7]